MIMTRSGSLLVVLVSCGQQTINVYNGKCRKINSLNDAQTFFLYDNRNES
jgi:hypothetical protein